MLFVSYRVLHVSLSLGQGHGDIIIPGMGHPKTVADIEYIKRTIREKTAALYPQINTVPKGFEGERAGNVHIVFWSEVD